MSNLSPLGGGGGTPARGNRSAREVVARTRLAGLELDGMAALHGRAIERTVDLYDHAALLAETRPELRSILMNQVVSFTQQAAAHIRSKNNPFGL